MATEREQLMAKAEELKVEFKRNISNVDLQLLVDEAEAKVADKALEAEAMKADSVGINPDAKAKQEDKVSGMRKSTEMVKVKITPLDPRMTSLPSDMQTHLSKYGTKKQAVPFGKPFLVYKYIADIYKAKKTLQQVNASLESNQGDVEYVMAPAYIVEELPLTAEELEEVKGK